MPVASHWVQVHDKPAKIFRAIFYVMFSKANRKQDCWYKKFIVSRFFLYDGVEN